MIFDTKIFKLQSNNSSTQSTVVSDNTLPLPKDLMYSLGDFFDMKDETLDRLQIVYFEVKLDSSHKESSDELEVAEGNDLQRYV